MPDYEKAAELLIDKVDKLREQVVELKAENEKLKGQIGDLRAAAVRKSLMKGGCFTGKL